MKVIGLIGGIGAGKSTVVALMQQIQPVSYISADLVGHEILLKGQPGYEPVVAAFGKEILNEQGEIDRKKLGQCVFKDAAQVARLNGITHPIITEEIKVHIKNFQKTAPTQPIILEAALLIESGLVSLTDQVIAVYAAPQVRLERVMQRETITKEQVLARIKAQKEWEALEEVADYIIDNSISLEDTKEQVAKILASL